MSHPLPLPLPSGRLPLSSRSSSVVSAPASLFFPNQQGSLVSMVTPGDLSLVTKEQMIRPLS